MAAIREEQYKTDFPQPGLDADYTKGRFAGKVCIITGGASGIGRATTERFLNDGASVHIFDINDQNLEDAKQVFQSKGLPVEVYKVDVTEHAQCQAAVAKVAEKHGGHIHYLVNSAAIFIVKGYEEYTKEDWTKTTSVHVAGTSTMVQVCLPYMVQAGGKNCAIVNMSSADADGGIRGNWVYSSAKAGIRTLTRCMALDLSTHGIRVNSVSPGWVWSPVNLAFMKNREMVEKDYVAKFHMLKRVLLKCRKWLPPYVSSAAGMRHSLPQRTFKWTGDAGFSIRKLLLMFLTLSQLMKNIKKNHKWLD